MGCKLVILDHPGTTWNIVMAMNVPVMLCWNKNWFPLNEEADIYLERFRALGIFFDNPNELSKRIADVYCNYSNFSNWWSNAEIQSLRKEWMSKYALADKRWRNKWVSTYLKF